MAASQQGKKKKKVLSQQHIEKLLGMLKEEDKPLRAGILAKTLGYQSAKDINPTLLRLEGYGMVSRVTMNNTPLWKYCSSREGVSTAAVMALPNTGSSSAGTAESLRMLSGNPRQENGSMHPNSIDLHDDARPSRPQSTKADLEWDPTDIQAHHDEDDDPVHLDNHTSVTSAPSSDVSQADFHQIMSYSHVTTNTNYINPAHNVSSMVASNDTGLTVSAAANFTEATLNSASSNVFTTTPTYPSQGLYNTVDTRPDHVNMHMTMNGMDSKQRNNKDYMNQGEFTSMHGYGSGGGANGGSGGGMALNDMNGGPNMNMTSGAMQGNFNINYAHHANHESDMNHDGPNDIYMTSNHVRHMSNGVNPGSVQSGLQNFPVTHNQGPSDFPRNNHFSSSISSTGLNHKSPGSSGFGRANHSHNHYSQSNYAPNNGNMRNNQVMPTYVVQEIIKAETVGQYGMTGPQGPPPPPPPPPPAPQETRTLGGYQSVHHHHQHGLDPGVMPYSQQQYHHTATGNLNNNAPNTQHHHHQHQQQMQTLHHHHHHHQQAPLTQAANFVNMGHFPNGPYNQYQNTFGLGASNRTYSGQHQGPATYSNGNMNSKDFANYSGVNTGYRNTQAKRQHFSGFTSTGTYQNHIRTQVAFNKLNQGRHQSFSKQNYGRGNPERHRGGHHNNRSKSGNGQGQNHRQTNHHHYNNDGKMRQRCNSGDKEPTKSEASKYMGTEVLDDICRRLAKQASLNQKTDETPTVPEKIEPRKETSEKTDKPESGRSQEESPTKDQLNNNEESVKGPPDGGKINKRVDQGMDKTYTREHHVGSRTQNHSRNYNGRYGPHYPYRGPYYNRDHNARYNNNNYRGSSRPSEGKQKKMESHGKPGNLNNNPSPKTSTGNNVITNGKREDGREEKDVSPVGKESNSHSIEKCDSKEKISDERPLGRYKAIIADHLDPNNVLLSHLFVKGLIDQVLVDRVRRMKTRRDAMERLLPDLLNITEEAITDGFCDALQKSGQGHLSELLKGTGVDKEGMSEKHVAFLEHHRQNIAASMIPDKDLLTYLRTDSVLTGDLYRFITSQPSRAQQIDTLLQILPFRGAKAFEVFRTALRRSGQPWLAEQIAMDLS